MGSLGDLRGILQYVPQFRGRIFVIALDGAVVGSENFANILLDLAVLHSLNIRIVLVHGAGFQIGRLAAQRGVTPSDVEGLGGTDDATLEVSIDAIARLGNDIMQNLTTLGLRAAITNAIIAHPAGIVGGIDFGHTGKIDRVADASLRTVLEQEMVPIVPPIGYDGRGNTLRLNSDACAAAVAIALGASKLIYLSRDPLGRSPRQLAVEDAEALAEDSGESMTPGFRSKLRHAARACRANVARAHVIDGSLNEALLEELFSNEGIGTMVYVDAYQQIRAARESDIPVILSLIRQAVEENELVLRTRREVVSNLGDYFLLVVDGNPVGTVAVHLYPDEETAELGCLYIRASHEGQGYGRRLVAFAEKRARELGAARLIALSTQASGYFRDKAGYVETGLSILPEERRARLERSGRMSRVFLKEL